MLLSLKDKIHRSMSNISNISWPFSENGFIRSRPSFYGVHFVNCYLLADGWEGETRVVMLKCQT